MQSLRELSNRHDGIELFMRRYDDDRAPPHVEAVIEYCRGISESDFRDTSMMSRGNAWLDDRAVPTTPTAAGTRHPTALEAIAIQQHNAECDIADAQGEHPMLSTQSIVPEARTYEESLTAWDLRRHLLEKRFNHNSLEDADRRLIHIANPSPCHMLALAETANEHQAPAIQDLLGRYLTLQTSMKVRIPTEGYPVFQLEHHFPYFGLHMTRLEDVVKSESSKPDQKIWMDLFFLDSKNERGTLRIYRARSSFTLSGFNNTHWIAYDLEEVNFNPDREIGEDERNDFRRSDQISMGKFDANLPFYDAREYYLAISLIRVKCARKEAQRIVGQIEASFMHHMTSCPFSAASASEQSAISKWNEPMLELLSMLIQDLRGKVDCWNSFKSKDLDYFSDPDETLLPRVIAHIERTINELDDVYEDLRVYEKTLSYFQEACEKLANRLEYRLSLQGGKIGEFTIVVISPVVIVSSIFAIPTSVLPYEQSFLSLFLSVGAVMMLLWFLLLLKEGWLSQQAWWQSLSRRVWTLRRQSKRAETNK